MNDNMPVVIVAPAYNEEQNIRKFIEDWYPIVENLGSDSKLVAVDDGSTDRTEEILNELAADKSNLTVLKKKNAGHGSAVLYGYRYAIEQNAEWIFQTDSDGQTTPDEFWKFWNDRGNYDALIGDRTNREDGIMRAFVERIVCMILWCIFGVKVPDANAPFRLMKTKIVEKYINLMPDDYFIPNILLTASFSYCNDKVHFLPISFKARDRGNGSINVKKIIKIGWQSLFDFSRYKNELKKIRGSG